MSATKNVNQSRPRSLVREADATEPSRFSAVGGRVWAVGHDRSSARPAAADLLGAKHAGRLARLVLGHRADLFAPDVNDERGAVALPQEAQRVPVDRHLAAANPHETAELHDHRAEAALVIDQ